jgi:hypothetical protein
MLMLDREVFISKNTWRMVSAIQDIEFHIKALMVVAFQAVGDSIAIYSLSGKRGPKPGLISPKLKFPIKMVEIAKGTFL